MAFLALNGRAVSRGVVTLPRRGPWTADLVVDLAEPPDGAVTLALPGVSLTGTVYRGGATRGASTLRVVGGAGGLGSVLPAKGYHGVTLELPLREALGAAGETLSPSADPLVLRTFLPAWSRFSMAAGSAIAALLHAVPDASWRVLADGTVWVGNERWLPTALRDFTLTKDDPHHGRQEIAALVPAIFPGETLNGRRVSAVEHHVGADSARATIYYE